MVWWCFLVRNFMMIGVIDLVWVIRNRWLLLIMCSLVLGMC